MTVPASPVELPQLPEPERLWSEADDEHIDHFDADAMRAHGQQCYEAGVRAERERAAPALERALWFVEAETNEREAGSLHACISAAIRKVE